VVGHVVVGQLDRVVLGIVARCSVSRVNVVADSNPVEVAVERNPTAMEGVDDPAPEGPDLAPGQHLVRILTC
jgi:hypothetical protein